MSNAIGNQAPAALARRGLTRITHNVSETQCVSGVGNALMRHFGAEITARLLQRGADGSARTRADGE